MNLFAFPNGLSSAPRIFTKLLKPALARLREDGVLLVIYIDDIILFADDTQTLLVFIQRAITLLQSLGFTIHSDKSQLAPSQRVSFLGFILDSVVMTVSMKLDKKRNEEITSLPIPPPVYCLITSSCYSYHSM